MPGFTASKILWLKNNEPENFARLRQVLLPHDFMNYHLTGRYCMEVCPFHCRCNLSACTGCPVHLHASIVPPGVAAHERDLQVQPHFCAHTDCMFVQHQQCSEPSGTCSAGMPVGQGSSTQPTEPLTHNACTALTPACRTTSQNSLDPMRYLPTRLHSPGFSTRISHSVSDVRNRIVPLRKLHITIALQEQQWVL